MALANSCIENHEAQYTRTKAILECACLQAQRDRNYNSGTTRNQIREEFSKRNKGLVAYGWQIDVAEALLLGLDVSVIAGTGSGKTMPFIMPLFK
ncbi:hypothetical protein K435DRAFT_787365 [Dendrothele bispora CBS 962.96]|uniref:DEAD/DEAH box helicase domain-containing protein n=1 Tax=Dendrothele bispora (strain CBS 962.96) TaxID=1314807 RepID=A0A4S8KKU3_DENBC|nr:hypothetical protein K435DRAFT_787365 [Dendrothele bispora CBS 962.96]